MVCEAGRAELPLCSSAPSGTGKKRGTDALLLLGYSLQEKHILQPQNANPTAPKLTFYSPKHPSYSPTPLREGRSTRSPRGRAPSLGRSVLSLPLSCGVTFGMSSPRQGSCCPAGARRVDCRHLVSLFNSAIPASPPPLSLTSNIAVPASGLDGDVTPASQHGCDLWDKMSPSWAAPRPLEASGGGF